MGKIIAIINDFISGHDDPLVQEVLDLIGKKRDEVEIVTYGVRHDHLNGRTAIREKDATN